MLMEPPSSAEQALAKPLSLAVAVALIVLMLLGAALGASFAFIQGGLTARSRAVTRSCPSSSCASTAARSR